MKKYDVVIVGAGAAGLLAGIRAADRGLNALVLDKMSLPGRKLMITGKGRCNITNSADLEDFTAQVYPDGRFLYPSFKKFFSYEIIGLLEGCGVEVMLERGGRYFPKSEKAADVVDALYQKSLKNGVDFIFNSRVNKIKYNDNEVCGVEYLLGGKIKSLDVSNVIICTGGKSYPATGSTGDGYVLATEAGHKIVKLSPILVPLETKEKYAIDMQGLTLKNINAKLLINGELRHEEFGDLLFTHFGLSGPVILTLSRDVVHALEQKNDVKIQIDFKPALDIDKLDIRLMRDLNENGKKQMGNLFRKLLPQKAIPVFLEALMLDENKLANQISAKERKAIVELLKGMNFTITGHRGFKEAVITAGGVCLDEITPQTMQSKLKKGLYFAGEVLDIDANTGGYNLQIAYSTGWLAADSI
ncbi:MAG: NAD(P)/FAD-dependent oxidoreductase [Bacteroidales bacterium]|nr:NAD(P)/FAD-dependent oxidoreductase [Bacteroidales bacterium]